MIGQSAIITVRHDSLILGIGILKVASGISGLLIRDDKAGRLSVMRYLGIRYHVTLTWMVSNKSRMTLVVMRLCYVWI